MKRKAIVLIIFILTLGLIIYLNIHTKVELEKSYAINKASGTYTTPSEDLTDVQKAMQEIAYAYYMRGPNMQYNQRCFGYYSPEEATSQNRNYITCSSYVRNVYNELLSIKTPKYTKDLMEYSANRIGNGPEVIAYGKMNGNNMVMKFYDNNSSNNYKTINNPTLSYILPYLKVGDIITFRTASDGHTMLVYDLIYENGQIVDAIVIHSLSNLENYTITKIQSHGNYLFNVKRLKEYTYPGLGRDEGGIRIENLSDRNEYNENGYIVKNEYSILRFIQKDTSGNDVIIYKGSNYEDRDYNSQRIILSDKTKDRLKYKKLFIEKTVNVHTNNIVKANEELLYSITIQNNSNEDYLYDLNVIEYMPSKRVKFIKYEVKKNGKSIDIPIDKDFTDEYRKLEWNIGKLKSQDEVIIAYTGIVQGNENGGVNESYIGKTLTCTGSVANIPTAVINNTIGNYLTPNQSNSIKEKYNELRNTYNGKQLIDEIYKSGLGINLNFKNFNITNLVKNTDITSTAPTTTFLNENINYYSNVLNNYWNTMNKTTNADNTVTFDMKYWEDYTDTKRRADVIYEQDFKTGDILIYKNSDDNKYSISNGVVKKTPVTHENGEYAYIFIEGYDGNKSGFVGVNLGSDGEANTIDDRNEFNKDYYIDNNLMVYSKQSNPNSDILTFCNYQTLLGKDYYVVLRPSLTMSTNDIVEPELSICYDNTDLTNQSVTAIITANEEVKNVSGWNLSSDKKTLTKSYSANTTESVTVKDLAGNSKAVQIKITNIDKTAPTLSVSYSTTSATNQNVTATITANEQVQSVSGWTLSSDKKILTKSYSANANETITVYDLAGNKKTINVKIENISTIKIGDLNENDRIDLGDLVIIHRHISASNKENVANKHPDWILSEEEIMLGDLNKNGRLDIGDGLKIQRYIAAKNNAEVANQHPDWLEL